MAMARGEMLRSHRGMDGQKSFLLHPGSNKSIPVKPDDVHKLRKIGLIDSNKKFPVATFWLTEAGARMAVLGPSGNHGRI